MESHPRFILEGACGVGKTTLARALSTEIHAPVYRPFRGNNDHIPERMVRDMQDLGISVNGWEEDLYTADIMSTVGFPIIIDRSMPSALTWDSVRSEPLDARSRQAILRLWVERIVAARAILVLVGCDAQTRLRRSDRGGDWEVEGIRTTIRDAIIESRAFQPPLTVWRVESDSAQPDVLAFELARKQRFGKSSPNVVAING